MASKWKKRLGKAAALAAGIYGATRFGQARKKKALNAITAGDIARPKNYQIPDTNMGAISPTKEHPQWIKNAIETVNTKGPSRPYSKYGNYKKGGLVKKGKPKLAKRGWK